MIPPLFKTRRFLPHFGARELGTGNKPTAALMFFIEYAAIILFFVLLVCNNPGFFVPTLIRDDALIYFKYAYEHDYLDALMRPHNGYLNLYGNLAGVIAAAFPLTSAPLVMMAGGLFIWVLLLILIVAHPSPFLTPVSRALAMLLALVASSSFGTLEVNKSHFFTAGALALIMLSSPVSRGERIAYRSGVVFCGLTGPVSCFLIPIYAMTAIIRPSKERFLQFGILLLCGVIQLAVFWYSLAHDIRDIETQAQKGRFMVEGQWDVLIPWLANHAIVKPLLGYGTFERVGWFMEGVLNNRSSYYLPLLIACTVAVGVWGVVLSGIEKHPQRNMASLLALAGLFIAVASFYAAYTDNFDRKSAMLHHIHRYFITPSLLMCWALTIHASHAVHAFSRILYYSVIAVFLGVGIHGVFVNHSDPYIHYADWSGEIARWKNDPNYRIRIAPRGNTLSLTPSL